VPPPEPAAHSDAPAASTAASPTSTAARAADAPLPPAPPAVAVRADTAPVRDDASPAATAPPDARSAAADDDARIAARYAAAERKLVGAPAAARDELEALVGEFPRAPATAAALLDLAWLAVKSGDAPAARSALDRLAEHPAGAALAMSAAYLRCIVERERAALQACLTAFRSRFPDSPNDPDVLARLAVSLASAGDCRAARPLLVEYAQRYPRGSSAATLQMLRDRCGQ
jgi:outer membrane protein assembly factor BamD (BamD/ComL family)